MRSDDRFDAEVGRWRRTPTRASNTTALTHGDISNGNCGSSMSRCRTATSASPGRCRPGTATGAPASLRIVWTCVQYAASVQYQRVTLSDLSAAAGVSERRVRDAFSDCHGMSPTAYLRVAALREVRRKLLDGPFARDPVTRAASDFGFWHLSRFAGQYRALFGESPSETVARARSVLHVRIASTNDVLLDARRALQQWSEPAVTRIGLALGGGGACGFSHIGVLRVLDMQRFGPLSFAERARVRSSGSRTQAE